jgi:hypothetical protein
MTIDEALLAASVPFHRSEDGYDRAEAARVLTAEVHRLRAVVELADELLSDLEGASPYYRQQVRRWKQAREQR